MGNRPHCDNGEGEAGFPGLSFTRWNVISGVTRSRGCCWKPGDRQLCPGQLHRHQRGGRCRPGQCAQQGITLWDSPANTIGGTAPGAGNVISGNDNHGIWITRIRQRRRQHRARQLIGRNATNTAALGNTVSGIYLVNVSSTLVGGSAAGAANVIANNGRSGVEIAGTATGNTVSQNSIFGNVSPGIDLGGNGVTANDVNDPDTGPNKLQNFPVIQTAVLSGANLNITYAVPSVSPNSAFPLTVEFFIADGLVRQGKTYLGSDTYARGRRRPPPSPRRSRRGDDADRGHGDGRQRQHVGVLRRRDRRFAAAGRRRSEGRERGRYDLGG